MKGYQGRISYDGRTITVAKRLRGEVTIPAEQVTAVEILRAGIGMMAIRFTVAGPTAPARTTAIGSTKDALNDPYSLPFRSGRRREFEALRDAVKQ